MNFPRLFSLIFAMAATYVVVGQNLADSVMIHFRQSKVDLDTTYMHNDDALRHIRQMVEMYKQPNAGLTLRDVKVVGGASPEGTVHFNEWLSRHRAERIFECIENGIALPQSVTTQAFLGRDWPGLRTMVLTDPEVPYKQDVVNLLDEIIAKTADGEKESDHNLLRLKQLHKGVPYLYLYYKIFPDLREANVVLTFSRQHIEMPPVDYSFTPVDDIVVDTLSIYDIIPVTPKTDRPFYMALKTNMIADALCLPELGVEFYLGKNISIVGNWMYGWWDNDSRHRYWRAYGGDLAVRWWFGSDAHRKPLTGHHIGVYGGVVTYDFEFGGKGHMGGRPGHNLWDRCMHYCGIEYGYSLPIARRFNIDFTAGLGYMGGKYVEYVPNGICYEWIATKQKHWWGPTKLEVSLVWLIGHGNYNVKKQKGAGK